jgi:hypothetical protein
MMSSTLMIPPTVQTRLREGLFVRLGDLGIAHSTFARVHNREHEAIAETRRQLEGVWRLLDKIGWIDGDDAQMLTLSVATEEGAMVLAVMDFMVSLLAEWLDEMDPADPRKPERADELRVMRLFVGHTRHTVRAMVDGGACGR